MTQKSFMNVTLTYERFDLALPGNVATLNTLLDIIDIFNNFNMEQMLML